MILMRVAANMSMDEKELRKLVGQRLKELREERLRNDSKWTQEYVAKKIRVSKALVSAYERGERLPPGDNLRSLAELYSVSTDYLLWHQRMPSESPEARLRQLGAHLRSAGATEDDVQTIMDLLETRKRLREAVEEEKSDEK